MTLTLISIGLTDEKDLSQRALQAARDSTTLYAELYTTILDTDTTRLSTLIGRPIQELTRPQMEENSDTLIKEAATKDIGILVGGDALTATTHIALLIEAIKKGVETRVIHGSSILTAIAETGLSPYKLGRTVTLPLPEKAPPTTVLKTLKQNREHGLHTLILLDLDTEHQQTQTINQAIQTLIQSRQPQTYNRDTLTIGISHLGWRDQKIRADTAHNLANHDFGDPPHTLLIPGELHFLEAEALKTLADCPTEALENHSPKGELDTLIQKYSTSCKTVIKDLETQDHPQKIDLEETKALIKHAERYLKDAEYYALERKATALTSVSYAEGVLDALKLLGLVKFEWERK
ncbi:MAG: diphthine synthase [Candidatus Bathyarchaeota archaeon]|jgi:diphthine synthase